MYPPNGSTSFRALRCLSVGYLEPVRTRQEQQDRPPHARPALVDVEPRSPLLDGVMLLGDSERRYLNLLTHSAWDDYAEAGHVLAAVDPDGSLLGYAVYRLPRTEVVLAHLVVAPAARSRGVARALVDELSTRHRDRRGIKARCRRDYPANLIWPKLGFVAQSDAPGRSKVGYHLTAWWRDHAHPDLLTWEGPTESTLPVVMDANVFFDLHSRRAGDVAGETRDIILGTLAGRVDLLVAPELHNEIDRNGSPEERAELHSVADGYPRLSLPLEKVDSLVADLAEAAGLEHPGLGNWTSDLRQVAWAAAAGARALVTRDESAISKLGQAAFDLTGIRVVTPPDLVTLVDEVEDDSPYAPASLLGTELTVREASTTDTDDLTPFIASHDGESGKALRTRLRELAAARPSAHRTLVSTPAGQPIALLGYRPQGAVLRVDVLRVTRVPTRATLAMQLVAGLRNTARDAGCRVVLLADPHPQPDVATAADRDGYLRSDRGLVALTLPLIATASEVAAELRDLTLDEPWLEDPLTPLLAALDAGPGRGSQDAEHLLRPCRMTDSALPAFLVPIRPAWAVDLFGVTNPTLFARPASLGLSTEHVYYRSVRPAPETAPARILWYVSKKAGQGGYIAACSTLLTAENLHWTEAWRRYRRLGIYTRTKVRAQADSTGFVRALHVTDTQILDVPIHLDRLRALAWDDGRRTPVLQSPWRMSARLFETAMQEGRRDPDQNRQ